MEIDTKKYLGFIYIATNKIDNKKYIGQKTFSKNWKDYLGSGILLQRAVKKYGKENFKREILCLCKDRKELNEKEIYYISLYNAVKDRCFYNLAKGGNNINGFKCWTGYSESKKEEMRKLYRIKNSGKGNPFYGKHHSERTKQILREKSRSRSFGENNSFYGKHHSEETKKIISQKAKERYVGANNPFYGKRHTEESKKKMGVKSKRVAQFDKENNLLNEFISTKDASEKTGVSLTGIRQCVIGANLTSGGFIWKYI